MCSSCTDFSPSPSKLRDEGVSIAVTMYSKVLLYRENLDPNSCLIFEQIVAVQFGS